MAKGKKRPSEYESKVGFDGNVGDLINLSARHAEMKSYKEGDIIQREGKDFKVIATRETDNNIPEGYMLILEDAETGKRFFSN